MLLEKLIPLMTFLFIFFMQIKRYFFDNNFHKIYFSVSQRIFFDYHKATNGTTLQTAVFDSKIIVNQLISIITLRSSVLS